jgi:hypothetical protein
VGFAAHYQAAPRGWALKSRLTPGYLLRRGPYRLSRNPMYAGEAAVWLGWALFYGSPAIWAGLVIVAAALTKIVRWEERRLLARLGDDYRAYLADVPRWIPALRGAGRPGARFRSRGLNRLRLDPVDACAGAYNLKAHLRRVDPAQAHRRVPARVAAYRVEAYFARPASWWDHLYGSAMRGSQPRWLQLPRLGLGVAD